MLPMVTLALREGVPGLLTRTGPLCDGRGSTGLIPTSHVPMQEHTQDPCMQGIDWCLGLMKAYTII